MLPFYRYRKTIGNPQRKYLLSNPQSLAEHIKKKRIDLGLFQKDIAEQIGVSEDTITYWEKGRSQPQVKYYPKIFALLGYYPFTHENESITSKLQQLVHCKGWNHSQCAKALGIDSGTVKRILKGQRTFKQKSKNIETLWSALPKNLKQQYRLK